MKRIRIKSIVCAVTALAAALAVTSSTVADISVSAGTLGDLQSKYDALEQKQRALKDSMNDTQDSINEQQAKQDKLQEKIDLTQSQISVLNAQISKAEEEISDNERQIAEKKKEIKKTYALFKQRMRASYMASDPSMFGILLGAESLSDFIMRTELVQRVSAYDKKIVDSLEKSQKALEAAQKELEADKATLQSAKDKLTAKQADLNAAYSKSESAMQTLESEKRLYAEHKEEIERQMAQAEREIQAALAAAQQSSGSGSSSPKYDGGRFTWPVPGYTNITSGYGWRTWDDGSREFHKGLDISQGGIYGARIVAAASGTVVIAQNYNSNGYGNYAVIDHGGGLSTLYGHTSVVLVSPGQKVKKGDTIARVGSTGWSTGPHLHFEVRVNGQHTSPWSYLK